jgi:ubiquinone/menaquinone biosynthesis C-methylase UbiE
VSSEFQFASEVVDTSAHDLPGRKAAFVVGRVPDGSVVVDVGCGGGKMLRTIDQHRHGVTLLGCDVVEPTGISGDFTFTLLDGATGLLPYGDASADVALLIDVLEHVDRPETVLSEIARILRPGGTLVAFVPIDGEPYSWYSVFRALLGKNLYVRTKDHINSYTHDQVERMLATWFIVDERRYLYHFFGQLMDATLWAALAIGPLRRAFWDHSPYHSESPATRPPSIVGRMLAATFKAANVAAWIESRLLRNVRTMSAGVLATARVRPSGGGPRGQTTAHGLKEMSLRRTSWAERGVPAIPSRTRFSPK